MPPIIDQFCQDSARLNPERSRSPWMPFRLEVWSFIQCAFMSTLLMKVSLHDGHFFWPAFIWCLCADHSTRTSHRDANSRRCTPLPPPPPRLPASPPPRLPPSIVVLLESRGSVHCQTIEEAKMYMHSYLFIHIDKLLVSAGHWLPILPKILSFLTPPYVTYYQSFNKSHHFLAFRKQEVTRITITLQSLECQKFWTS